MRRILVSILTFVFLFFLIPFSSVSAKVINVKEGSVLISAGEVLNDDLFVSAEKVVVEGTVNGDVFTLSKEVRIEGIIKGNLHAAASRVSIEGEVDGNIYIGSQNLIIESSKIGGSVISAGESVSIDSETSIGGSVISAARSININSLVERNVVAASENLTIGSGANIGKDLSYALINSENEAIVSEKAVIGGGIYRADTTPMQTKMEKTRDNASVVFTKTKTVGALLSFLGALIIGLISLKLFKSFITNASVTIRSSFWKSLGVGILVTIGVLPGVLILIVTFVGIPLLGIIILLLLLYGYMAKIVFADAAGVVLKEKTELKTGEFITFVLGLAFIYLVKLIPVLGGIFGMIVFWVGLGAITINIFKKN